MKLFIAKDIFDNPIPPRLFLCTTGKKIIGELPAYDVQLDGKWGSYSELRFSIDRRYTDVLTGETKVHSLFDKTEGLRKVCVENIGYFVIQDPDATYGDNETKTLSAFSSEYETGSKYLENFRINTGEVDSAEVIYLSTIYGENYTIDTPYALDKNAFDSYESYYIRSYQDADSYVYQQVEIKNAAAHATYDGSTVEKTLYVKKYPNVRFYHPTKPELSLLHIVFKKIPEWKIGNVDVSLQRKERKFDEDRIAVYDFLMNDVQDTFKCVVEWDTITNTVNFYEEAEDGITEDNTVQTRWDTDIFVSRENLASEIQTKYSTDDIKTKLKVSGADNLDIREINLGKNYIMNLDFYHNLDWMEQDLFEAYDNYLKAVEKYSPQYTDSMQGWVAAYNKWNELMNAVPVEGNVVLVGDEFKKLYCLYNSYNTLTQEEIEEMQALQVGGNVDLFNRPQIPSTKLSAVGWSDAGTGTSTVFTCTYSNEDETIAINVTPIFANGDVMSPDELEGYALGIIYNEIEDYENLQIGSLFTGANAVKEAGEAAERIHELQEKYYLVGVSVDEKISVLKKKLKLYKVNEDTNANKTDNILLRLKNANDDVATIRIYNNGTKTEPAYLIQSVVVRAASGTPDAASSYEMTEWVSGKLTSERMNLKDYKVSYIGTMGAYFVLAKDEKVKANLEDYGIKLLQEKQKTYTTIFQTQTEQMFSQEKCQCVASDEPPAGDPKNGTRWLDTNSNPMKLYVRNNGKWEEFVGDLSDYENYQRYIENYEKLQAVQEVLVEKETQAQYCRDGYEVPNMRIVLNPDDGSSLEHNMQWAAIQHFDGYTVSRYDDIDAELPLYKFTTSKYPDDIFVVYLKGTIPYVSYDKSCGMYNAKMNRISELTDFEHFFSAEQWASLSPLIREDEFSDDNFLLTGYESEEERLKICKELVDAASKELKTLSQPSFEFSMDMANILALPEFASLTSQFQLGNFIRVHIHDNYIKRARLLEVHLNFDDMSDFSCSFGNLITTKSEIDKHADLLSQAVTAGKQVAQSAGEWQKAVDKSNRLETEIANGLQNVAIEVGKASGQAISWDEHGFYCRKYKDGSTTEYEKDQIAIINNKLVFTNDSWQTSKAALGEFEADINGDGVTEKLYGLIADCVISGYIEGCVLKGGQLEIGGDKGKFVVHEDGSVEILGPDATTPVYATKDSVDMVSQSRQYHTELMYAGSTIFTEPNQSCTITCKVYEWDTDITDKILENSTFKWIRSSNSDDSEWNNTHTFTSNNTITITNDDVKKNAQFSCQVQFDDTILSS